MGAKACEFTAKTTLFLSLMGFPSLSVRLSGPWRRPRETRFEREKFELYGFAVWERRKVELRAK